MNSLEMDGTLDFYSLLGGKSGYSILKNTPTQSNLIRLVKGMEIRMSTKKPMLFGIQI